MGAWLKRVHSPFCQLAPLAFLAPSASLASEMSCPQVAFRKEKSYIGKSIQRNLN